MGFYNEALVCGKIVLQWKQRTRAMKGEAMTLCALVAGPGSYASHLINLN